MTVNRGSLRGSSQHREIASALANLHHEDQREDLSLHGTQCGGDEGMGGRGVHRCRGLPRIRSGQLVLKNNGGIGTFLVVVFLSPLLYFYTYYQ